MMFINIFLIFSTINLVAHIGYYLVTIQYTTINEVVVDFLAMEILVFLQALPVYIVQLSENYYMITNYYIADEFKTKITLTEYNGELIYVQNTLRPIRQL